MNSQEQQALESTIARFEQLQPGMDSMRQAVADHVKEIQKLVIRKRAGFEKELSELNSQESELKMKIEELEDLQKQMSGQMSKEIQERDSTSIKVKEMRIQQEHVEEQIEKFKKDIEGLDEQIGKKMRQLNDEKNMTANEKSTIEDRTFQYERLLGMRIETGGKDNLLSFIFCNVDPDDFEREVYFVLDPATYSIVQTSPELEENRIKEIMDEFSKSKEIMYLWRDMRKALKEKLLSKV